MKCSNNGGVGFEEAEEKGQRGAFVRTRVRLEDTNLGTPLLLLLFSNSFFSYFENTLIYTKKQKKKNQVSNIPLTRSRSV